MNSRIVKLWEIRPSPKAPPKKGLRIFRMKNEFRNRLKEAAVNGRAAEVVFHKIPVNSCKTTLPPVGGLIAREDSYMGVCPTAGIDFNLPLREESFDGIGIFCDGLAASVDGALIFTIHGIIPSSNITIF